MTDYNVLSSPGNYKNGLINAVIEIPLGSTEKIEWSRLTNEFELDRQEPSKFPEPVNYGFIPKTTGGDGDNLDVFIISDQQMKSGSVVEAKIIGIMNFIDDGVTDDKIVAVPIDVSDEEDALSSHKEQIEYYYNHYKDYIRPGITKVVGWGDKTSAQLTIEQALNAWLAK